MFCRIIPHGSIPVFLFTHNNIQTAKWNLISCRVWSILQHIKISLDFIWLLDYLHGFKILVCYDTPPQRKWYQFLQYQPLFPPWSHFCYPPQGTIFLQNLQVLPNNIFNRAIVDKRKMFSITVDPQCAQHKYLKSKKYCPFLYGAV